MMGFRYQVPCSGFLTTCTPTTASPSYHTWRCCGELRSYESSLYQSFLEHNFEHCLFETRRNLSVRHVPNTEQSDRGSQLPMVARRLGIQDLSVCRAPCIQVAEAFCIYQCELQPWPGYKTRARAKRETCALWTRPFYGSWAECSSCGCGRQG